MKKKLQTFLISTVLSSQSGVLLESESLASPEFSNTSSSATTGPGANTSPTDSTSPDANTNPGGNTSSSATSGSSNNTGSGKSTLVQNETTDAVQSQVDSLTASFASLEEKLFNRTFPQDKSADRLLRIERFVFGEESKGDAGLRVKKLQSALSKRSNDDAAIAYPITVNSSKPRGVLATINEGIDNYNRHRFHNAEDDFNDALDMAPGMPRIYVYLGVTLLQINQRQSAIDALRTAYELDPFGTYGRYAKHCLIVLMGDEEVRKRGPKDNLKTVQGTIDSLNRKAGDEANRQGRFASVMAQAKQSSANSFANSLRQDSDSYSNEIALKQSFVRMDAMVQMARVRQEAARRAANTQEAANNLKTQISAKLMPGDAKLRAFGTTLHARYYGDETYNLAPWYIPREMPLQLKARAVLLPLGSVSKNKKSVPLQKSKKTLHRKGNQISTNAGSRKYRRR